MDNPSCHNGKEIDHVESYKVIMCEQCGFRHINPIPLQETIDEFYKKQYYDSHKTDYIFQDNKDIQYLEIAFEDRLNTLQRLTKGKHILDVGCGSGMFMKYAQDRGWECTGIEPSKTACGQATGKGLNALNTTFDKFVEQSRQQYDVIHLKNVLEHVPDPIEIIRECNKLLYENGILYIEVPNDYNMIQRFGVWILKEKKSWLAVPDHINYFNFSSLKKILNKNGYNIAKRETTFPMYLFLLFGLNFIKTRQQGEKAHSIRVNIEMYMYRNNLNWLRRIIYTFISYMGLGRTVIYYSIKR